MKTLDGTPLFPKITECEANTDHNKLSTLKEKYENLLRRYKIAEETISSLKKEVIVRDTTINELLVLNKVKVEPVKSQQEVYEEHLMEVEAIKNNINVLSTHNLKLQERLEILSIPSRQSEVSEHQLDLKHLNRKEGMTGDEEFSESMCKSCLQKRCFNYRSYETADVPYSSVAH